MHFIQFMINVQLFFICSDVLQNSAQSNHPPHCLCHSSHDLLWCDFFSANKKRPSASGLEFIGPLVSSVEETPDPICTVIKGQIPFWITGSFLRNGPGKFEFGESK